LSKSEDVAYEAWKRSHNITDKKSSTGGGFLERLRGGVKARIDEQTADMNQRISDPKGWRQKHHELDIDSNRKRIKELELENRIANLNAKKARSERDYRRYTEPASSGGGYDMPLFDMGAGGGMGGGGGSLFDLSSGMGGGGGKDVPLFDLGSGFGGDKPRKKKANKKKKGSSGSGIHIHINK
jgi:hypothetical protein